MLQVAYRSVASLVPYARNARTHSDEQVAQIATSIETFGWTNPILVDGTNGILAGHGRLRAAQSLGMESVPVIELAGLTEGQRRALILADNQLALNAGWDMELLASELAAIDTGEFDIAALGFSDEQLEQIATWAPVKQGLTHPDDAPALPKVAVSRLGDLWICGPHRVLCGDATLPGSYAALMGGGIANCCWTDPPYNVAYGDKAEMLGRYDKGHRNTSRIMNDDMKDDAFLAFLRAAFVAIEGALAPGAAIYVAHAETEGINFRLAFRDAGLKLASCVIWRKNQLVLGRSDFQWIHEPVLYGWKVGKAHRWFGSRKKTTMQELGPYSPFQHLPDGRWQVAVGDRFFIVAGDAEVEELVPSVLREDKPQRSDLHPTMKPVALIERMLSFVARAGDSVLDSFGGSGSTMMAAERLGMRGRLMELDPAYVDVIVRRWQDYTGSAATLDGDGATFDEVCALRVPSMSEAA